MTSTSGECLSIAWIMQPGKTSAIVRKLRGRGSVRKENTMAEDKPLNTGVDDVAKHENENRRDTYDKTHGSGNPHLQLASWPKAERAEKINRNYFKQKKRPSHPTTSPVSELKPR